MPITITARIPPRPSAHLSKKLKKSTADEGAVRMPRPRPWEAGGSTATTQKEAVKDLAGVERVLVVVDEFAEEDIYQAAIEMAGSPENLLVLYEGANALGAREMGVVPHCGPGWKPAEEIEDFQNRRRVRRHSREEPGAAAERWKTTPLRKTTKRPTSSSLFQAITTKPPRKRIWCFRSPAGWSRLKLSPTPKDRCSSRGRPSHLRVKPAPHFRF